MLGPYSLTEGEIDKRIRSGVPGNYAYGHQDKKGIFIVQYVGRSDTDLNSRIKHGIGKYSMFKFSYASSAKEAFERECKNYHDFGGDRWLDNEMHPDRPKNTDYECPICTIFDD